MVHVLDIQGHLIHSWRHHAASVTALSIDARGDFLGSCSDDGRVIIRMPFNTTGSGEEAGAEDGIVLAKTYQRPVKAMALDPDYSKSRQFVVGGMAGQLVLVDKGWLRSIRETVIYSGGEDPIWTLDWSRRQYIVWSADSGVRIWDTQASQLVGFIPRDENGPRVDLYRCYFHWVPPATTQAPDTETQTHQDELVMAWANMLQIIKWVDPGSRGSLPIARTTPTRCMDVSQSIEIDGYLCGIAFVQNKCVVLVHGDDLIDETAQETVDRNSSARPEIRILDETWSEVASDVLTVHGYELYQPHDYRLVAAAEDVCFIVSPKDVIMARSRDTTDHIDWLLERARYEEALEAYAQAPSSTMTRAELGQKYLDALLADQNYTKAASLCPSVLGADASLWEKWIYAFAEVGQLAVISPFVPVEECRLGSTVYEMILANLIRLDPALFHKTVKSWSLSLYDAKNVLVVLEDALDKSFNVTSHDQQLLLEGALYLYENTKQLDKALECYLKLGREDVVEFVEKNQLYGAVLPKWTEYLLQRQNYGGADQTQTATHLVDFLIHHLGQIPVFFMHLTVVFLMVPLCRSKV